MFTGLVEETGKIIEIVRSRDCVIITVSSDLCLAGSKIGDSIACLLYTSPSPRDRQKSRMPSSA